MKRHLSSPAWAAIVTLTVVGFFTGCVPHHRSPSPRTVAPENRLSIENALNAKTVWPADELRIEFTCGLNGASLDVSGKIFLTGGIRYFNTIEQMRVEIFFTNDDGLLVGRSLLYSAGYRVSADEWGHTFHKTLSLPEGATQMAFGYDGRVREGGAGSAGDPENGGTDYTFWHSPLE